MNKVNNKIYCWNPGKPLSPSYIKIFKDMNRSLKLLVGISCFCLGVFSQVNAQSAKDVYRMNEINRSADQLWKRQWDGTRQQLRQQQNRVYERELRQQREYQLELPGNR